MTAMEARQKQLIIMYHEIRRLRDAEHFSIQRIADQLKINFRTVKKILGMTEEDYDSFIEKKWAKAHHLDPYRDFIVRYLQQYPDTPAAVMHDKLKEQFATLPKVDPKTVYMVLLRERYHSRNWFNNFIYFSSLILFFSILFESTLLNLP